MTAPFDRADTQRILELSDHPGALAGALHDALAEIDRLKAALELIRTSPGGGPGKRIATLALATSAEVAAENIHRLWRQSHDRAMFPYHPCPRCGRLSGVWHRRAWRCYYDYSRLVERKVLARGGDVEKGSI